MKSSASRAPDRGILHDSKLSANRLRTRTISALLAAPVIPHMGGSAAAQITTKNWWWISIAPGSAQRMGDGISLNDLVRGGLVVSSDNTQPAEVVLVAAHLRGGKVISSGLTQPLRTGAVRAARGDTQIGGDGKTMLAKQSVTVNRWHFDFALPSGSAQGRATGTATPAIDAVRQVTQPVLVPAIKGSGERPSGLGGNRPGTEGLTDLGIYAGGAYIERTLMRTGAISKLDWNRYEALYLLAVPTDPQQRQQMRAEALLIPFVPWR